MSMSSFQISRPYFVIFWQIFEILWRYIHKLLTFTKLFIFQNFISRHLFVFFGEFLTFTLLFLFKYQTWSFSYILSFTTIFLNLNFRIHWSHFVILWHFITIYWHSPFFLDSKTIISHICKIFGHYNTILFSTVLHFVIFWTFYLVTVKINIILSLYVIPSTVNFCRLYWKMTKCQFFICYVEFINNIEVSLLAVTISY